MEYNLVIVNVIIFFFLLYIHHYFLNFILRTLETLLKSFVFYNIFLNLLKDFFYYQLQTQLQQNNNSGCM